MEIKKEIIFDPGDLENYLREKGVITSGQTLEEITPVFGKKTIKLSFRENIDLSKFAGLSERQRFLLDMKLENSDLSVRAINVAKNANIETIRELLSKKIESLARLKSFGKKTLMELKFFANENNFQFGTQYP